MIIVTVVLSHGVNAQKQDAATALYQEFEQYDDVFSLSFNKKMLESLDTEVEWGEWMRYVQGDLHRVKMMVIDESTHKKNLAKYIKNELKKMGYKLAELPDNGEHQSEDEIFLFSNKRGKKLSEAHILVKPEEGSIILFSIYGDLTITDQKL